MGLRFESTLSPATAAKKPAVHVLAIGGDHQFGHFMPVAFELERRQNLEVQVFATDHGAIGQIARLAEQLDLPLPRVTTLRLPAKLDGIVPRAASKLLKLGAWSNRVRGGDVLLCAERTSTVLKRLPGRCPPIVHIPHGAGDRAKGFEKRFSLFDQVIVAGEKDRSRLVSEGLVRPERCAVSGSVKVAATFRKRGRPAPLFDNLRPVILYNPHFSRRLTSVTKFLEPLLRAVIDDGRYNLIIAPHVRFARDWTRRRRARWEAMAVADRIIVDLGSPRSMDMTYTLGADIYVGDVSSQVYEFLLKPRPCVFFDAHGAPWRDGDDYAMWRFGEVVANKADILPALDRAFTRHEDFLPVQKQRVRAALDGIDWDEAGEVLPPNEDPIAKAADLIEAFAFEHARMR